MEPLNDDELSELLRTWEAPPAPAALRDRVMRGRRPGWRWLLTGSIRIPVPLAAAVLLALAVWLYVSERSGAPSGAPAAPSTGVSLADFQPVPQLEPRIVGTLQ